jgi:hypothetical protein
VVLASLRSSIDFCLCLAVAEQARTQIKVFVAAGLASLSGLNP